MAAAAALGAVSAMPGEAVAAPPEAPPVSDAQPDDLPPEEEAEAESEAAAAEPGRGLAEGTEAGESPSESESSAYDPNDLGMGYLPGDVDVLGTPGEYGVEQEVATDAPAAAGDEATEDEGDGPKGS